MEHGAWSREQGAGSREQGAGWAIYSQPRTQIPAPSSQPPAASTQHPAPSRQQPAASSQQPAASSQQPAASSQQPAASSQQPAEGKSYSRLTQKQNYTRKLDTSVNVSNYSFMLEIAAFLKTYVVSRERNRNYPIERISEVRTHKLESKLVLFDYLAKFPLFGLLPPLLMRWATSGHSPCLCFWLKLAV
jgi:hypothetical protein